MDKFPAGPILSESTWRQHRYHHPTVRQWRHLPARRAVGGFGQRDVVDVLFWSLLCGFLDITPTLSAHLEARLSTLPSRLSAGIQQRWNGCLKRTIPSVKGVWVVMKQEMFLSCHAPSFQFCSLSDDFAVSLHTGSEVHARHRSPQNDWCWSIMNNVAWLAAHANMFSLQVRWPLSTSGSPHMIDS